MGKGGGGLVLRWLRLRRLGLVVVEVEVVGLDLGDGLVFVVDDGIEL